MNILFVVKLLAILIIPQLLLFNFCVSKAVAVNDDQNLPGIAVNIDPLGPLYMKINATSPVTAKVVYKNNTGVKGEQLTFFVPLPPTSACENVCFEEASGGCSTTIQSSPSNAQGEVVVKLMTGSNAGTCKIQASNQNISPAVIDINIVKVEIITPANRMDFDITESDFTETMPIAFRAKLLPDEMNWQGDVNWLLDIHYDTTISRGPWSSQKVFQVPNDATNNIKYSSEGGELKVKAMVNFQSISYESNITVTVTGVQIPDNDITQRLTQLYNGVTSNVLTGIAVVESDYRQFDNSLNKYGVKGRWPIESYDGGSHIGLMQMQVNMDYAWSWMSNTQAAANLFAANLQQSNTHVNNIRNAHAGLRDLTDVEHENNALAIYNTGTYYYVPNATYSDWEANQNNLNGVNYANDVRNNLR